MPISERQRFLNWLSCQERDHGLQELAITVADERSPTGTRRVTMDELRSGSLPEQVYADCNRLNAIIARGETTPLTDI